MEISSINMISFRNHEKTKMSFGPGITIIWGKNGSGKTSILEAIHSLSLGSSFRTNNKKDLITEGSNNFLHHISTCVLENMNVSYGGARYKTFEAIDDGAPPLETSITLNFREMELITRERVHEGF